MPLPKPGSDQESERARALLAAAIDGILSSVEEWGDRGRAVQVPLVVADDVESLCDTGGSYRDAVLVLLAFPAANETVYDITDRFHNDRSTSDWLGRFLRRRNIHSVASALQNSSFRHAFVHPKIRSEPLRNILLWASEPEREHEQIRRAFDRVARRTAETARQISQLPPLDATRLTYQRTLLLAEAMLEEPSEGACEQYTFAALKAAEIETGDEGLRMATKNVRASDAGRVAGDVQGCGVRPKSSKRTR